MPDCPGADTAKRMVKAPIKACRYAKISGRNKRRSSYASTAPYSLLRDTEFFRMYAWKSLSKTRPEGHTGKCAGMSTQESVCNESLPKICFCYCRWF